LKFKSQPIRFPAISRLVRQLIDVFQAQPEVVADVSEATDVTGRVQFDWKVCVDARINGEPSAD
jgi:hypothetical protein